MDPEIPERGKKRQRCQIWLDGQPSEFFFSVSIFWDQEGIVLIDYHPKCQTVNAEYYSSLLVQLKDILKEKRHATGRSSKGSCSCTTHRALATQKKLAYLGFQCLDHPPYSPDLAPLDYHMFPGLKKQLNVRYFSSDAEVIAAAETWLDRQNSEILSRFQYLEQRSKNVLSFVGSMLNKSRFCSL